MYVYQPLKSKLIPTIEDLSNAVQMFDIEFDKRDPRPFQACSLRVSNAVPRLAGNINTRKTGVQSFKWKIYNDYNDEIFTLSKNLIQEIIRNYIKAPLYGVFAISYSWELDEKLNKFKPVNIKSYLPTELDFDEEENIYIIKETNGSLVKEKLEKNYIAFVPSTDWLGGIMRSVVYYEALININMQEWHLYNKKVKGLIQGKTDTMDKAELVAAIKNFVTNNVAVTDKDAEILLNELAGSNYQSYSDFIQYLKNETAIAILGQANTQELPKSGGSKAALQVLDMIRQDVILSDMLNIKYLCDKFLVELINLNYGNDTNNVYFDFIFDDNEDIETNARVVDILQRAGIPLIKAEVYQKTGFTMPKEDDLIFEGDKNLL